MHWQRSPWIGEDERWNHFWNVTYSVQTKCQTFCLNIRAKLKHTSLVYSARLQIQGYSGCVCNFRKWHCQLHLSSSNTICRRAQTHTMLFTVFPQSNVLYVQRSGNSLPLWRNYEGNLAHGFEDITWSNMRDLMFRNNSYCYRLNVHNVTIQSVKSGLVVCLQRL